MGEQELLIQFCWPFPIYVYLALKAAGIEDRAWPPPPDRTPGALNQKPETWIGLTWLNTGARSMAGGAGGVSLAGPCWLSARRLSALYPAGQGQLA